MTAERSIKVRTRSIREQFNSLQVTDEPRDDVNEDEEYEATTAAATTTENPQTFTTTTESDEKRKQTEKDASEVCERYPDTLIGRQIPNTTLEIEWDEVAEYVGADLDEGGCWEPTDCKPRSRTAIIVPYKDREVHLKRLLYYGHPFWRRQKIAYCVIVAEQFHDGRFNKGILMNAGFVEAMKLADFDCVVFHDVDMLPEDDHNTYACGHVPIHLSLMINKYDYRYPYGTDFGGVTMMSAQNYTYVNGHTNVFWGWGREDSDIEHRIHNKDMKIEKPKIFDSARYSMCVHAHPWTFQNEKHKQDIENSYQAVTHKMLMKLKYWRANNDGLNSLAYSMRGVTKNPLYTHMMIESRLLIPRTVKMTSEKNRNLINIEYDDSGLKTDAECEMVKFENATLKTNLVDSILRKEEPASERCLEIGNFCQGFASSEKDHTTGRYFLRELPLLAVGAESKAFVKQCPGNLAYYQLASEPIIVDAKNEDEANNGTVKITYEITAEVNFNRTETVWYRDSQLFNGLQVNEFTAELEQWEGNGTAPTSFIRWTGDREVQMVVLIEVPKQIPGFYTVLSKMVDVMGQPILEFNWNFRVSTGDNDLDRHLYEHVTFDPFIRQKSQKIASMWGRSIMNAVNKKGLDNIKFTFNADELKSPAERRAEMRGKTLRK